jgi:hypothetical protein
LLQIRLLLETRLEDGKTVTMDAFTLVVNAHGGLLEITTKLPKGQQILLINAASGAKISCRVLAARKSLDGVFAVAFEFESPSADFWPMNFPPPDWRQLVGAK